MYDSPPTAPTPWPALKRGLAGASDAEAQRRLVEFGNEVEEVAHEALLLMFREVRRFVPSPPYDFLRLPRPFGVAKLTMPFAYRCR